MGHFKKGHTEMAKLNDLREFEQYILQVDGQLYQAIATAYQQEQEAPGTAEERHVQGVMAAIKAVYMIGENQGYTAGYNAAMSKQRTSDEV